MICSYDVFFCIFILWKNINDIIIYYFLYLNHMVKFDFMSQKVNFKYNYQYAI